MRSKRVKWLTFDAMALALIMLLTLVPFLGYIPIGPLSITILHIPVLIFAYFGGLKRGWLYGLMFGVLSLIRCLYPPHGVLDAYFINPFISILPRVLFGFLAGAVFEFVRRIPDLRIRSAVLIVAAGILTVIHTLMVMGMLAAFNLRDIELDNNNTPFLTLLGVTMLTGSLPECAAAMLVAPPVILSLQPVFDRLMNSIYERKR